MSVESNRTAVYPSASLLVVIGPSGVVELLQPRTAPQRRLTLQELDLISAFSQGEITDIDQGLGSYMEAVGLNENQRESSSKLARQLLRRNRLEVRSSEQIAHDPMSPPRKKDAFDVTIPEGPLVLRTPCSFRVREGMFETVSHNGIRLPVISSVQLLALSQLVEHAQISDALSVPCPRVLISNRFAAISRYQLFGPVAQFLRYPN